MLIRILDTAIGFVTCMLLFAVAITVVVCIVTGCPDPGCSP